MNNSKISSNSVKTNLNKSASVNISATASLSSSSFKNKNASSILVKQKISNTQTQGDLNTLNTFLTNFQNETTKYHLMKNKIYLLCQENRKLVIYNVLKLKKIAEWDLSKKQNENLNFDTILEILNKHDQTTLKSWFTIDIKLGIPTLTFKQDNLFANQMNFDFDYLEKILEKTNFLSNLKNAQIDFKFTDEMNSSNISTNLNTVSQNQLSQTFNSDSKFSSKEKSFNHTSNSLNIKYQKKLSVNLNNSCGSVFIKNILNKYFDIIFNKYTNFFETNFYDTRNTLKKEMSKLESEIKLDNVSNYADEVSDYFIFSIIDNNISVGPYKSDLFTNLKFRRPNFLKEIVKLVKI
jgi:hypothetical protein